MWLLSMYSMTAETISCGTSFFTHPSALTASAAATVSVSTYFIKESTTCSQTARSCLPDSTRSNTSEYLCVI